MGESNEVRVKNEPICESQSIPDTKEAKSQSILVKAEEKFSATEEFANKISIGFLNEETTAASSDNNPITNRATTRKTNKTRNKKTNRLQNSK